MYFADTRTGVMLEEIPIRQNKVLVGTYDLTKGRKKVGVLTIHPKGMVINGKKPKEFGLSGNKATWKGITGGGVFRDGFFEFSDKGDKIIRSSSDATGRICPVSRNQPAVKDTDLSVQDLFNQYPFDEDGLDKILDTSKDDIYTLIEYFMPEDYLHHFIRPDRPQLDGYLTQIAQDDVDNPGENATFYESLSVPYLTYELSMADHSDFPEVVKLNSIRSDNRMKTTMQDSPVYNRHSGKMYRYYWRQEFPRIDDYLDDQKNTDYSDQITQEIDDWEKDIMGNIVTVLTEDEQQAIKEHLEEIKRHAIDDNTYWAYRMYRDLTSTERLNNIRVLMLISGGAIDDIMRQHEQACSIMSILDPSSFFTFEFTSALQIYQLSEVIPGCFDPSSIDPGDLDVFSKKILEEFVEMYHEKPDTELKDLADKIQTALSEHDWEELSDCILGAASVSTDWTKFNSNVTRKLTRILRNLTKAFASVLTLGCLGKAISFLALGMVDFEDLDALQQAEFIAACVKIAAFGIKQGVAVIQYLKNGYWEPIKAMFYRAKGVLANATSKISGAIGRFIVKHGWANKMAQGLKQIEKIIGKAFGKAFKKIDHFAYKLFKGSGRAAKAFGGLMSIAGAVFCAIDLATASSPMESAMDAMFLVSSVADIVAVAADWLLSGAVWQTVTLVGGYTVGATTIASISTIASGIALGAAVVGFVVMIVLFCMVKPIDYVQQFVDSDEVKNGGFFMEYDTTIEYFAVKMDDDEESEENGITVTPDGKNYMYVNEDGSITFGDIEYSYSTVFTVSCDEYGYSQILTKQTNPDDVVYYLSINDDNAVAMSELSDDKEEAKKQQWIIDCTGNVVYTPDEQKQLKSATFSIYNEVKKMYVTSDGKSISSSTSPQNWTIELEYTKPGELSMADIVLNTKLFNKSYHPYLGQPGSTSGRSFSISPALPSWLEFDNKIGSISQAGTTTAPVTPATTYTMTVTNSYGSDSDSFVLKVEEADQ
jgi:hypothetical protein